MERKEGFRVLGVLVGIKVLLWGAGLLVALLVPLSRERYFVGFHHVAVEPRAVGQPLDFFSLWTYGDAEWYQAIASRGYPPREAFDGRGTVPPPYAFAPGDPLGPFFKFTEHDAAMKYAFFPLYPLLVRGVAAALPLGTAAFLVANLASLAGLWAVFLLGRTVGLDGTTALRGVVLMALFPFGVFFQASYAEGLFVLLAALSIVLFLHHREGLGALAGALLCLTKGVGVLIVIPLLGIALAQRRGLRSLILGALAPLGLLPYMLLNVLRTGSWTFFHEALAFWGYGTGNPLGNLARNLTALFLEPEMAWMSFHSSRIDALVLFVFLGLLLGSFGRIPLPLWVFSGALWITPLLRKDLMSFGRYMAVVFPLFLYGASLFPSRRAFFAAAAALGLGALATHGMLVQWVWVG